jgi:preprotein translocase subunit YajC
VELAGFLPFVLIALVFWLLIVRPQRRRQQDLARTQDSIGPGTEVMLGSGIYGTVSSVQDETLHLEVAPGTTLKVARQAVVRVVEDADNAENAENSVNTDNTDAGLGEDPATGTAIGGTGASAPSDRDAARPNDDQHQ